MNKITVYVDDCENLFIVMQENLVPTIGLLIAKQDSSGTLQGDIDGMGGGGFGTVYNGQDAALIMLRLWGLAFAEITDGEIKPLRKLSHEEEAYIGLRQ